MMLIFLCKYLVANTLSIGAVDHEEFFFKIQDKKSSFTIKTNHLSFSDEFYTKYTNLDLTNNTYAHVKILCDLNIAEYWLPFLLSSIVSKIKVNSEWTLEFKIEDITKEFKQKILINTGFLNFKTIIINDQTIDAELINKYRNLFLWGLPYYIYIESMGWTHLPQYKSVRSFVSEFFYLQTKDVVIASLKDLNNKDSSLPQPLFPEYLKNKYLKNILNIMVKDHESTFLKQEQEQEHMLSFFWLLYSMADIKSVFSYSHN